jgi:hypothetical protein
VVTTAALPDWLATTEETAAAMAAWARDRGLSYERHGLLPPASKMLRRSLGDRGGTAQWVLYPDLPGVQPGKRYGGGLLISGRAGRVPRRPPRFSENLCSGTLPGGLAGTLAHHTFVFYRPTGGEGGINWVAQGYTAVVAMLPEGRRVTRDLEAIPRQERMAEGQKATAVIGPKESIALEFGPVHKEIDLTPSMRERYRWEMWAEDDERLVTQAIDLSVVARLDAVPEETAVTVRGGMLVVEAFGLFVDPGVLDSLARLASGIAERLRRMAAWMPRLEPGTALQPPADTRLHRWATAGAALVDWPQPPPDVAAAIAAYGPVAKKDPVGEGTSGKAGRSTFVMMLGIAVIAGLAGGGGGAIAGALGAPGGAVGLGTLGFLIGFGVMLLIGSLYSLAVRGGVRSSELEIRTKAWGLQAFAAGYARARGLEEEDREELRRRLTLALPGTPHRSLRGRLPGGMEGRLVLWQDHLQPPERQYVNLALVPASGIEPDALAAPFATAQADGWLAVYERVDDSGRSITRLDALAAEAARLTQPTS